MRINVNCLFSGILVAIVILLGMNNYPKLIPALAESVIPRAEAYEEIEEPTPEKIQVVVVQPKAVEPAPIVEEIPYPTPRKRLISQVKNKPLKTTRISQTTKSPRNTLSIIEN